MLCIPFAGIVAVWKPEMGCRVAPGGHPPGALPRSGRGDFHHPALPAARLAALTASSARLVRYLPEFRGHGARRQCVGPGSLRKLVLPRAALARPGPGVTPVPRRQRSYAARRLPAPFSHRSGSPGVWPPSLRALVLCRCRRRHVRPPRVVRRRRGTGSPPHRRVSRRGEGLPGSGAVRCVRAMVAHPAG
jgi:hypothetical protein